METKKQDSLLDELKQNQLSKESMSNVMGGGLWDQSWVGCSNTGDLAYYIVDGVGHLYLNGVSVYPEDVIAQNDHKLNKIDTCFK